LVASDIAGTVAETFRKEAATVLATLIRQVGDFQLAEDAVQDAYLSALVAWPRDGVPTSPGAWIMVAARRRAIDRLRRDEAVARRAERLADLMRIEEQGVDRVPGTVDGHGSVADDRLRLIFTCCHPALDRGAQVALTLRTLGGLTTAEIGRAFLVAEPTMGKRIVRAKNKIAKAGIRYRTPGAQELPDRLRGVLRVVYLIFNEGYSATGGNELVRAELCAEAIRLGRLLCELMPSEADVWGLTALMLLHDARRAARTDHAGAYVPLGQQDRSRWDHVAIGDGMAALARALRLGPPGPYQLQAAIAAAHLRSTPGGDPSWSEIAALYEALVAVEPSPVVAVNRAVAVGHAHGAAAGLALLEPLLTLERYQPLHAAHAELLLRCGDLDAARKAYGRAIELSGNDVERAELVRRLGILGD